MERTTFDIIPCKCCNNKEANDYIPIYSNDEPIRVSYWLCEDCYQNTTYGMKSDTEE